MFGRTADYALRALLLLAHKEYHGRYLRADEIAHAIGAPRNYTSKVLNEVAKAGLINFMQCAARDLAPYGVRANALSPGMVRTDLNESVWAAGQAQRPAAERQSYADWAGEKIRKISPLGRWQTAEECAAMAVFLASDAGRNITGQTLNIDGGQVMHA